MNYKKRIILIIVTLTIINLFIGCGNNTTQMIYNDNSKIADESDTFGLDENEETLELGLYKGNLTLSGSGTIWRYQSSEDFNIDVPYTLSVKSGKAKIVLISPDNTVTTLIENTDKAIVTNPSTLTVPIKKGTNRMKIVGYEKSDIDIEMHIEKGTFQKISFK